MPRVSKTDKFLPLSSGDSEYLPPEEAAAQQQQRRASVSTLTSPLKTEGTGEFDQKLVRFPFRAHYACVLLLLLVFRCRIV